MNTTSSVIKLAVALLAAQKAMGNAVKGSQNPFFKSSYADLNAVREVAIPALNAVGIVVLQPTTVIEGKNYVETVLLHESGEVLSSLTEIKNPKGDAQSEGSGISYARRYGLQSLLNIGAVDDDAETTMTRGTATKTAATKATPAKATEATPVTTPKATVNGNGTKTQTTHLEEEW